MTITSFRGFLGRPHHPWALCLCDFIQFLAKRQSKNLTFPPLHQLVLAGGEVVESWPPVQRSLYHRHMDQWRKHFPANQLLVVDGDRFITTPWEEMERVQDFLGIPRVITKESFFYNTTKGFYCGITQESACTNSTTSDTTTTTTAPTTSPPAPTTSDTTTTPAPTSSTTAPTTSILVSSSKKKCLGRSKGRPSPPVPLWLCRRLCRYFKPHNVQFFHQIERQAFDWACRCG